MPLHSNRKVIKPIFTTKLYNIRHFDSLINNSHFCLKLTIPLLERKEILKLIPIMRSLLVMSSHQIRAHFSNFAAKSSLVGESQI